MQRRRPSHPADLHIDLSSQPLDTTADNQGVEPSSASPATARKRVSSATGNDQITSTSTHRKPRQRATSSAIGIPLPDIQQVPTPGEEVPSEPHVSSTTTSSTSATDPQGKPRNMPAPHSVLPSYSPRPSRSRPSFKMLVLVMFLAFVFILSFFPASRDRSKAAVGAVGGYAGQAWTAAGSEWDKLRGPPNTAVEGVARPTGGSAAGFGVGKGLGSWTGWGAGKGAGTSSSSKMAVRERPALHPDPTKTTRCETSFDGKRSVVQYAIMIDAGSTGSRVHVYKFNYCKDSPELEDEVFEMLRPGLSSFAGNPKGAADSLRPLLTRSLASVPKTLQGCTPIAVKATAGLRLLGGTQSGDILREVRRMLKEEYPFPLADGKNGLQELTGGHIDVQGKAVEIMEGKDEGVFAWITVNYLLGLIGPPLPGQPANANQQTAAVMDLGGASTQIVFEPKRESGEQGMRPGEHVYELKDFGGRDYTLYQNSYLGYGLMQARKSINSLAAFAHAYSHPDAVRTGATVAGASVKIPSPCFALGTEKKTKIARIGGSGKEDEAEATFVGTTGGFDACRRLVEVVMDKDAVCASAPCSFAGVYQPSLMSTFKSGAPIVALSYFYDRLHPLGLTNATSPSFTISQLSSLARDVCSSPQMWPSRFPSAKYPEALKELYDRPESCLDLTYLYSLLSLGYELEGDVVQVRTEKKLGGIELGWALGAAVGMLGDMPGCKA
ncbi:unnamed protein product [Sympodiomycopsis kandeliae]